MPRATQGLHGLHTFFAAQGLQGLQDFLTAQGLACPLLLAMRIGRQVWQARAMLLE